MIEIAGGFIFGALITLAGTVGPAVGFLATTFLAAATLTS